jgi:hypothetical protein
MVWLMGRKSTRVARCPASLPQSITVHATPLDDLQTGRLASRGTYVDTKGRVDQQRSAHTMGQVSIRDALSEMPIRSSIADDGVPEVRNYFCALPGSALSGKTG